MKEMVIHIITWILNNKSDELAVLSIFLGMVAVVQSWKYSKDSEKIMEDTSFILVQQISLLNELKKNIIINKRNPNILSLSKDKIKLYKMYGFKKHDIPDIMKNIKHLNIKGSFMSSIESFLNGKNTDYVCNFNGEAQSDGEVDIIELYEILLKYNVIMIIDYR